MQADIFWLRACASLSTPRGTGAALAHSEQGCRLGDACIAEELAGEPSPAVAPAHRARRMWFFPIIKVKCRPRQVDAQGREAIQSVFRCFRTASMLTKRYKSLAFLLHCARLSDHQRVRICPDKLRRFHMALKLHQRNHCQLLCTCCYRRAFARYLSSIVLKFSAGKCGFDPTDVAVVRRCAIPLL